MNKPLELSSAEWKELMQLPVIRESWGIGDDETPEQFADMVYGVKFQFASGGPGYVGDLYILHGDALGEPMTLRRSELCKIIVRSTKARFQQGRKFIFAGSSCPSSPRTSAVCSLPKKNCLLSAIKFT
jgi:hypothetical protein